MSKLFFPGLPGLMIVMLFGLLACSDQPDVQVPDKSALNKAPFAGITDSIEESPSNKQLYQERALRLSQHNLHELATDDYKKAWELKPDELTALALVNNLLLSNKVQEAAVFLKQCIKTYPENTDFRRRLGEIYYQTGNLEKALVEFDAIIEADPENFDAWMDKATILVKARDTSAAIAAMEKAFSLQPIAYIGLPLANLYAGNGNARALDICNTMLKGDSSDTHAHAYYIKGIYYSETNNYQGALTAFDKCIQIDWNFIDAHLDRGILFYDKAEYIKAREAFKRAVTVANSNSDAYYWLARAEQALNNLDGARENYQRALQLEPGFKEARNKLAEVSR